MKLLHISKTQATPEQVEAGIRDPEGVIGEIIMACLDISTSTGDIFDISDRAETIMIAYKVAAIRNLAGKLVWPLIPYDGILIGDSVPAPLPYELADWVRDVYFWVDGKVIKHE